MRLYYQGKDIKLGELFMSFTIESMKNYKLLKSKHSQGEIVATILLVLLVISAAVILISFVIPFIKDKLSESECFEYAEKVDITNNEKYTCYDKTNQVLNLQVHIGDIDEKSKTSIKALTLIVQSGSDSKVFKITPPNSSPSGVLMFNDNPVLEIPLKNQERTYKISNINSRPNSTSVYPILNNDRECSDGVYTATYIPFCS